MKMKVKTIRNNKNLFFIFCFQDESCFIADFDGVTNSKLTSDMDQLGNILEVVLRKYTMPPDMRHFVQVYREQMNSLKFYLLLNPMQDREAIENLFEFKDMFHPPLNLFFHLGRESQSAPWWEYFIRCAAHVRQKALPQYYHVNYIYNGIDFSMMEPSEDINSMDEDFVGNPNYNLPDFDKLIDTECYICGKFVSINVKLAVPDTYPLLFSLVTKETARKVPLCSCDCHILVTHKIMSLLRDFGNKVIVPKNSGGKMCDMCQTPETEGKKLMKCARCKNKFYCGKECQVKDWPEHKKNCKKIKQTLPTVSLEDIKALKKEGATSKQ